MKIQTNPDADQYLAHLNQCFANWGNREVFDWVFNDAVGPLAPERFILTEEAQTLAGSALTFRRLNVPGHPPVTMGTMTGSWTLPAARGKGCFTEIIAHSLRVTEALGVGYLTAFVTEQNASFRRLAAAGSALLRTHYAIGKIPSGESAHGIELLEVNPETIAEIYESRRARLANAIHYDYSLREFRTQFIDRPTHEIKFVAFEKDVAIIEETPTTCRILHASSYECAFIDKLSAWAAESSKNIFFMSATDIGAFKTNPRYELIPGYFTVLPAAERAGLLGQSEFIIEYGDKM